MITTFLFVGKDNKGYDHKQEGGEGIIKKKELIG